MRSQHPGLRRLFLILLASAAICLTERRVEAGIDTNRVFLDLAQAETIEQRVELCAQLSSQEIPAFLGSFCQAIQALAGGLDSLAVRLLEESLRQEPGFSLGCVAFGDTYLEREQWGPALRWYERAQRVAPERLDPYYGIGRAWLAQAAPGNTAAYEKALTAFRSMTAMAPKGPDGWANVGMVLAFLERFDEAEGAYRKALALDPKNPDLLEGLGSLAARRGNEEAAEETWKKALAVSPAHASSSVELAALYGRQGKIAEAEAVLTDGVAAAHVGPAAGRLRRDLALLSLLEEKPDRAAALLEEARVLSPDARTLAALAHVRMLGGKPDQGIDLLAEAAVKDSACVRPFARAWRPQVASLLENLSGSDPMGAGLLKKMLAHPLSESEPAGARATPALVRLLLKEWKLPQGKLVQRSDPGLDYDTPPVPVYRAMAVYPEAAGGIEGTVMVRVRIDAQGGVVQAGVAGDHGNPALEWAAVDAAKRWRFQPAAKNGRPVESEVTIPFRFSASR